MWAVESNSNACNIKLLEITKEALCYQYIEPARSETPVIITS